MLFVWKSYLEDSSFTEIEKKNVDFKKKMFAKMYRAFLLQATEQEEM